MKTKRQFEEILERIHAATGARTQAELAALLDIKRAGISEVKRRGTIPSAWYLRLFEKLRLNPLWLRRVLVPRGLQRHHLFCRQVTQPVHFRTEKI